MVRNLYTLLTLLICALLVLQQGRRGVDPKLIEASGTGVSVHIFEMLSSLFSWPAFFLQQTRYISFQQLKFGSKSRLLHLCSYKCLFCKYVSSLIDISRNLKNSKISMVAGRDVLLCQVFHPPVRWRRMIWAVEKGD
jgi:hypothetical protein